MEFYLCNSLGGQNRAIYTYNRGKRKDVEQARCNINSSCQDSPIGRNRAGEVNKQLLPVGYLVDQETCTCPFQVGFLGHEQVCTNR